jgi:hypothetical protein
MAQSTGIVLTATGIAFANDWAQTGDINMRIPVAGLGVALLFAGVEQLDARAGVGLAYLMLITALVTPINGKSPAETVVDWTTGKTQPGQPQPKQKGQH